LIELVIVIVILAFSPNGLAQVCRFEIDAQLRDSGVAGGQFRRFAINYALMPQ